MDDETIKAIGQLGQPLRKLIDAVQSGIGKIYEPTHVVRMAKAEARAHLIRTSSEACAMELQARVQARLHAQEVRRQQNIDAIVEGAARQLPEAVSPQGVDPDWVAHFFNCAQDVSNEEMESLWSRILAGEVTQPGSFSRRTISAVSLFSREDAAAFTEFCSLVWKINGRWWNIGGYRREMTVFSAEWASKLRRLANIGLISSHDKPIHLQEPGPIRMEYQGRSWTISSPTNKKLPFVVDFQGAELTQVGNELAPIAGAPPNLDFRDTCIAAIKGGFIIEDSE